MDQRDVFLDSGFENLVLKAASVIGRVERRVEIFCLVSFLIQIDSYRTISSLQACKKPAESL